jgi:hypothetical protein
MARYQNQYREELEGDETTYSEDLAQEQGGSANPANEEDTFKKRYGDLRRHMQQTVNQHQQQVNELQGQLDSATRKQIKFPKTEEEITAWAERYPDVAKIIDTIAQKRAHEVFAQSEQQFVKVKELQVQVGKEKAENELRSIHPDFDEIRADSNFHEWVTEQPQNIQDSLYKNQTDAKAASRAIDLYKVDTGISTGRGRKSSMKNSTKSAARSVNRSTSSANPPSTNRMKFSESMVQSMSSREYEQHEDAIMQSMREGTFDYDLTGSAR